MVPNKVSAVLDDTTVAGVMTAIAEIKSKLPFLIDLASDELKSLPRLGGKNLIFTTKALALIKQDSGYLPRDFSVEEMEKDVNLFSRLQEIRMEIAKLAEMVEDTYTEVGSEAYAAALVVYDNAKRNGANTVGMDDSLDEMSKRFYKKSKPEVKPQS
ncbi:MAG: hypothetical protein WC557_00120 [Ignavibacteriaceae bacterium]